MFIVCKACDGSGEGVYGHSWTTCPVCNGAGQIVMILPLVPYFEAPVMPKASIKLRACVPTKRVSAATSDTDPMGVFPDETYEKREHVAA